MEFEDENEKEYYYKLESRVKELENKYNNLKKEINGSEDEDIKLWENDLNEMKEIKNYFDEFTNKAEDEEGKSSFIDSYLEDFKELALYHINKERIKSIEDKELIQEENEESKKQLNIIKEEVKKINENKSKEKVKDIDKDNSKDNDKEKDSNNYNQIISKPNHVGKLNRNSLKKDSLIYSDVNLNINYQGENQNQNQNYNNNNVKDKDNTIDLTLDILSKKSLNDSNDNFWNKYNYYDQNDLKKKNGIIKTNNNSNNINSNSNQDIERLMNSNNNNNNVNINNKYTIGNQSEGISSNMRKYSPYILNKKTNY
jgi:hypothetical protein